MFIQRTHNWKIRYQIFLLQFTALLILILFLLFALFLLLYITYYNNKEDSTNILIKKLMPKYLSSAQYYYKRSISQQFAKFSKQLYNVNSIYQFNVEFNVNFNMTLEVCQENEYAKQDVIPYTQFCYSIRNPIENQNIDNFLALSKQLTLFISMLHSTEGYYFTSVSKEQYFSLFPMSFLEGFYPHTRPWYQRQVSSQEEQVYSDPYLDFDPRNGIMITLTQKLENVDCKLAGVVGMDIVTRQFPQFDYMTLNSYIIDEKGRIIVSKRNQEKDTDVSYFYQEQITGYNKSDFESLLNFIKYDKIPDQQCMGQGVPCMENKLTKEYEMGYGSYLKINDYMLIILMNTKFYQEYFDLLEQIITESLFENIKLVIGILCGHLMLFIIIQLLAAQYLQKPIELILIQAQQIIKDHSQAKIVRQPTFIKNYEIIEELTCAFNRLVASMDRNDLQFLEKEQLYPTRLISFYYYMRQINLDELMLLDHNKPSAEKKQKWMKVIRQIKINQRRENMHSFNFIDSL